MVNYNCKTMHILVTLGLLVKKPLDRSLIPQYQFNKTKQHKNNEMLKSKSNMLSSMCVLFYSSFVCISAFANVSFQTTLNQHSCVRGPLRECGSIQSGASGLPYYCAPLACVSEVIESLAVWRHNIPKTKMVDQISLHFFSHFFDLRRPHVGRNATCDRTPVRLRPELHNQILGIFVIFFEIFDLRPVHS